MSEPYAPKNPRVIAHLKRVHEQMPGLRGDNAWCETPFADQLEHELNLAALALVEQLERDQPLRHWQLEISAWASQTFPGQTPASKAKHLHNEAGELMDDPGDGEEMADILILLLNLAEMAGVDLLAEVQKKMVKNRARQWNAPDEHGVCKHVEGT